MGEQQKKLGIVDHGNYRKLREPFENKEVAGAAVEKFWEEFYELRNKYKLPDVYVIAAINVLSEDGEEYDAMLSLHAGTDLMREPMVTWAYGFEQAHRIDRMGAITRKGLKHLRKE